MVSHNLRMGRGVFTGVLIAASVSGAHLNPAVTWAGPFHKFSASLMPLYISAQVLGAMFGSTLAWLTYKKHFDATDEPIRSWQSSVQYQYKKLLVYMVTEIGLIFWLCCALYGRAGSTAWVH